MMEGFRRRNKLAGQPCSQHHPDELLLFMRYQRSVMISDFDFSSSRHHGRTDDDNDDDSLESLELRSSHSVSEQEQHKDSPAASEVRNNDTLLLSLLRHHASEETKSERTHADPVSALQQYYQKKGYRHSLAPQYSLDPSIQHDDVAHWRYTFACPQLSSSSSSSSTTDYDDDAIVRIPTVVVPAALSRVERDKEQPEIKDWIEHFFGPIHCEQKVFYFRRKKDAKRYCAWTVWITLSAATRNNKDNNSDNDRPSSRTVAVGSDTNVKTVKESTTKPPRQHRPYPDWVESLYRLDVCIEAIVYRECSGGDDIVPESTEEWTINQSPGSKICCTIQIQYPIAVSVVSKPCCTKTEARTCAISLLAAEISRQSAVTPMPTTKAHSTTLMREASTKHKILSCDTAGIHCLTRLPTFACAPFGTFEHRRKCYLYELLLQNTSGQSLMGEAIGLGRNEVTRIGILFSCDIRAKDNCTQSHKEIFSINRKSPCSLSDISGVGLCRTELVQRTVVNLPHNAIVDLKRFNAELCKWKTYGIGRTKSTDDLVASDCPNARTYIFVPLRKLQKKNQDLRIDWGMVNSEVNGRSSHLLVSQFPFLDSFDCNENSFWTILLGLGLCLYPFDDTTWFSMLFGLVFLASVVPALPKRFALNRQTARKFYVSCRQLYLIPSESIPADEHGLSRPEDQLVTARLIQNHKIGNIFNSPARYQCNCLPLDRVKVLPVPRDVLYSFALAPSYMPSLERELDASLLFGRIANQDKMLIETLNEATTVFPCHRYERLEFLGDSVLGFYLTVAFAMARPVSYEIDISELTLAAGKNKSLCLAFYKVGLPRLVHASRHWMSTYEVKEVSQKNTEAPTHVVADSTAADLFESVLGGLFLCKLHLGKKVSNRYLVEFLTRADLPFMRSNSFRCCLEDGIANDPDWMIRIESLVDILSSLHGKTAAILEALAFSDSCKAILRQKIHQTMLACALFDAPSNHEASTQVLTDFDKNCSKIEAAIFTRDCMYHLGAYSLQLALSTHFYENHPNAPPKDLHLLRTMVLTDDVIAYVAVKKGLYRSMLGLCPDRLQSFKNLIDLADQRGTQLWNASGGWFLGAKEFRKRSRNGGKPQYPGIGGGRLCGYSKKLDIDLTFDLAFSFKSIFGSLTLTFGLRSAWDCVFEIFEELTLLDIDELRSLFSKTSSICSSA